MSTPVWLTEEVPPGESSSGGGGGIPSQQYDHEFGNQPGWLAEGVVDTSTKDQVQMVTMDRTTNGNDTTMDTETTTTVPPQSNADAARQKTWSDYWSESFRRDGRTLLITLLIIVCMNIPFVKWVLYPFTIYSTWIHELCHGLAAEMIGGDIEKLEIFPDGSGLATWKYPDTTLDRRGFVASAGYQGTAVIGMLLLMIRRTKRGPRAGCLAIALMMVLSVALWIRNAFGIAFILSMGVLLIVATWFLSSFHMRNLYVVLAVTCSLNAITSVTALFGNTHKVNGEDVDTDAHTMAEVARGGRAMWAILWLCLSLVASLFGFMFAVPGPDEVADFTLCGMCQDMGCFYICNAKGQRLCSKFWRRNETNANDNGETSITTDGNQASMP